jgi:ABC-type branched-subunit amino acid transport system substrate-binding protein
MRIEKQLSKMAKFFRHGLLLLAFNIKFGACVYTPTEVWIGGLFPSYRNKGSSTTMDSGGVMRKSAFILAIDEINNLTTVLPNTTLKFGIGDSRRSSSYAIEEASRVVEKIRKNSGNFPSAIIGPASSGPTQMVQHICNGLVIPEIGYSATSPSLSDDSVFRFFARLPPSDAFQVVVMAHLLKNVLNVDSFVAISGPGLYSTSGIDALIDVATGTEYQMSAFKRYSLTASTDLKSTLRQVKEGNCNAIAVFAQSADYKLIFEAAAEVGMDQQEFVWVVSETFAAYAAQYDVSEKVGNILDGVFVAEMENGKTLGSSVSRYPDFAQLWGNAPGTGNAGASVLDCSMRKDDIGEYIWLHNHDLNASTPKVCSGFDGKVTPPTKSTYASFAYDAVWTAALAMHKLIEVDKKVNGTSLTFPNEIDRTNLYSAILGLQFKGATGDVQFSSTGDRNTASVTYNILQGKYSNGSSVVLENVGTFYQGTFTPVSNGIIVSDKFKFVCSAKDSESATSTEAQYDPGLILQFILTLAFVMVSFLAVLAFVHRRHKQQQDELISHRMTRGSKVKKKTISLKQSLKRNLIWELSINATVLLIEFVDLGTDWYAFQEDSFQDKLVLNGVYYFFMLTGSACSLVAIFFRVRMSKEVVKHYREGVEVVDHGVEAGDGKNIIDKIDPPEYLLSKYNRLKRQALITTMVGVIEDIPQFIFNTAKSNSTTATTLAITFSAISFGYKVSTPILWQQLGIIMMKQEKQMKVIDVAHSMLAETQRRNSATRLTPIKLVTMTQEGLPAENDQKSKYVVQAGEEMPDGEEQTGPTNGTKTVAPSSWNPATKLEPLQSTVPKRTDII